MKVWFLHLLYLEQKTTKWHMHKCIFQGKLSFKSASSFEKAQHQYENRSEVFFKHEVVFKTEEVFEEQTNSLVINRKVVNITTKFWKNTIELFDYIRQFALSGQVECWMVESGKILEYHLFEPKGDKAVILNYKAGKELSVEEGKEKEAVEQLTKVIDKYEMHSQAYERRGYVNLKLKSYEDARYDFDKSIRLDDQNAKAHYGRGRLNMIESNWTEAVDDFDMACKRSLAVEPLFWMARRKKAEALLKLNKWDDAIKELQLLVRRRFQENDVNFKFIPKINTMYINALMNIGEDHEALEHIENNLEKPDNTDSARRISLITDRGVVRKHMGQKDYLKDWKEAASLGEPRASKLIAEQD